MKYRRRTVIGSVTTGIVAGCVHGSDSAAPRPTDGESATLRVRSHELGAILVGPDGMTLYMFDSDTQGEGTSSCSGGCAESWPPLTAEDEPTGTADVTAELGTFDRDDGSTQVTANGWPLYYFDSDSSPGDAMGQGANDVWWVLDTAGRPIRPNSNSTETPDMGDEGP